MKLPHETRAHELAIKLAQKVARARWPQQFANLRNQAVRAANAVVLNLAEAEWKSGKAAHASYRIALGELGEVAAAMQLVRIRYWRPPVEALYEELERLVDFEPGPGRRSTGIERREFPEGSPFAHVFPDRPSGCPRTAEEWDFLRCWMEDFSE